MCSDTCCNCPIMQHSHQTPVIKRISSGWRSRNTPLHAENLFHTLGTLMFEGFYFMFMFFFTRIHILPGLNIHILILHIRTFFAPRLTTTQRFAAPLVAKYDVEFHCALLFSTIHKYQICRDRQRLLSQTHETRRCQFSQFEQA